MKQPMDICVGVCTCRSPIGLEKTLSALASHETMFNFFVIVVDNDEEMAAKPVLEEFTDQLDISYFVEKVPGIPFARNSLIRHAMERQFDYMLMIDDDEQPLPGWLDAMVGEAVATGADVVGGCVVPRFAAPPLHPICTQDFTKKAPAFVRGAARIESTANILLSRRLLDEWDQELFDSRFQFSGGSDTELLRRTFSHGYKHAFCESAYVREDIPSSRANEDWLLKRHYRGGNVHGRVSVFHRGWLSALVTVAPKSAALWLRGALRALTSRDNPRKVYLSRKDRARARGMLAALNGSVFQEYADPSYRPSTS